MTQPDSCRDGQCTHIRATMQDKSPGHPYPPRTNAEVAAAQPFQLGSISTGTLRTEDLLPLFTNTLERLMRQNPNPDHWHGDADLLRECLAILQTPSEWDNSAIDALDSIQSVLQDFCPPFVYFGARPGDGADFGFWPDMDSLDAELYSNRPINDGHFQEYKLIEQQVIARVNGRGNVTVMDLDRNVLWSTV